MSQQREAKPDIRLDLTPYNDATLRKAVTYLEQGATYCKAHEAEAGAADLGHLLLSLAALVAHHLPDHPPAPPAGIGSLN